MKYRNKVLTGKDEILPGMEGHSNQVVKVFSIDGTDHRYIVGDVFTKVATGEKTVCGAVFVDLTEALEHKYWIDQREAESAALDHKRGIE